MLTNNAAIIADDYCKIMTKLKRLMQIRV